MTTKPEEASPELTREEIEGDRVFLKDRVGVPNNEWLSTRRYKRVDALCDMALQRERYREALAELVRLRAWKPPKWGWNEPQMPDSDKEEWRQSVADNSREWRAAWSAARAALEQSK